jgi:hypothetical protein
MAEPSASAPLIFGKSPSLYIDILIHSFPTKFYPIFKSIFFYYCIKGIIFTFNSIILFFHLFVLDDKKVFKNVKVLLNIIFTSSKHNFKNPPWRVFKTFSHIYLMTISAKGVKTQKWFERTLLK